MVAVSLQEGAIVLDPFSVRMILGLVTLTLIVLSYASSRRFRSAWTAWWRAALLLFFAGNFAFLLNGTTFLAWANPPGRRSLWPEPSASGQVHVLFATVKSAVGSWHRHR
ncbi:hypothetical protein GCM10017707_03250 [Paenarthrobacter aurescens]